MSIIVRLTARSLMQQVYTVV